MKKATHLIVAAAVVVAANAYADEQEAISKPLENRHWRVGADAGLFSAVGIVGATVAYSPIQRMLIEAGVGTNFQGADLSLMPKLALGSAQDRFVLGAGVSATSPTEHTHWLLWFNADVGYEHRFRSGLALSAAVGPTVLLAGRGCLIDCGGHSHDDELNKGLIIPQFRVGVAYWR